MLRHCNQVVIIFSRRISPDEHHHSPPLYDDGVRYKTIQYHTRLEIGIYLTTAFSAGISNLTTGEFLTSTTKVDRKWNGYLSMCTYVHFLFEGIICGWRVTFNYFCTKNITKTPQSVSCTILWFCTIPYCWDKSDLKYGINQKIPIIRRP